MRKFSLVIAFLLVVSLVVCALAISYPKLAPYINKITQKTPDGYLSQTYSNELKQARELLQDEHSQSVFDSSVTMYNLVGDSSFNEEALKSLIESGKFKLPVMSETQVYFNPAVALKSGDVVIDAGALGTADGMPMQRFAQEVGPDGKVFAFDPDPTDFETWIASLQATPDLKIELIQKAVSNTSEASQLYILPWGGSSLMWNVEGATILPVQTVSIDDFVKERNLERVDLIKVDATGADLMVLQGAAQTLSQFKPVIAARICNTDKDLFELILYLNSLGLGYQFWLDAHGSDFYWGRVLYAKVVE